MSADTSAAPNPVLAAASWLGAAATRRVLGALEAEGHRARVVGGAVRNALLGRPVTDVDIATEALPGTVVRLAERAGLKAVPTGIAHGTVTVIAEGVPFEVTTLRRDVETHGRHATVAFTDDWRADAERRDFTMNALYCDAWGVVFDYVGGLADLERARVRFIGDAHARIREDYLRILRFFRFAAEYGEGKIDAGGLEACLAERAGLAKLSAERIRAELLKLLAARHVLAVLDVMHAPGLLGEIVGSAPDVRTHRRLHGTTRTILQVARDMDGDAAAGADVLPSPAGPQEARVPGSAEVTPLLALAALAVHTVADADDLMQRLRLSRAERDRLAAFAAVAAGVASLPAEPAALQARVREIGYRHGDAAADGLRLAWARSGEPVNDVRWAAAVIAAARLEPLSLPVGGADVVALGIAPGPRVGVLLHEFEAWWIGAGFPQDAEDNRRQLERLARAK